MPKHFMLNKHDAVQVPQKQEEEMQESIMMMPTSMNPSGINSNAILSRVSQIQSGVDS